MTIRPEKVHASRRVYQGQTIMVRADEIELSPSKRIQRDVVVHPGATAILPITTSTLTDSNTQVVLVKQYRHATRAFLWEIPAGTLEPGEEILTCAQRELREETGLQSSVWKPLHTFYTAPGFCDEKMHLFAAFSVTPVEKASINPPEDETIEAGSFTLAQIDKMIDEGSIQDAKTLVGLLSLKSPF